MPNKVSSNQWRRSHLSSNFTGNNNLTRRIYPTLLMSRLRTNNNSMSNIYLVRIK
jgi:hypothetical protein